MQKVKFFVVVALTLALIVGLSPSINAQEPPSAPAPNAEKLAAMHEIANLESGAFLVMKADKPEKEQFFLVYWVKDGSVNYVTCHIGCKPQTTSIAELENKIARTLIFADGDAYTLAWAKFAPPPSTPKQ